MNDLVNQLRRPGDEVFSSRQKFLIADTIERLEQEATTWKSLTDANANLVEVCNRRCERLEKENESLKASVYEIYDLEKRSYELRVTLGLFVYAMENCPDTDVYQSKEAYTHWITNFLLEPFSASKKLLRE